MEEPLYTLHISPCRWQGIFLRTLLDTQEVPHKIATHTQVTQFKEARLSTPYLQTKDGVIIPGVITCAQFLAEQHKWTDYYPTTDIISKMKVNSDMEWLSHLFDSLKLYISLKIVKPQEPHNAFVQDTFHNVTSLLAALNAAVNPNRIADMDVKELSPLQQRGLISSHVLLNPSVVTIADLYGLCGLLQLNLVKHIGLAQYPHLVEWANAVAKHFGAPFLKHSELFGTQANQSVFSGRHLLVRPSSNQQTSLTQVLGSTRSGHHSSSSSLLATHMKHSSHKLRDQCLRACHMLLSMDDTQSDGSLHATQTIMDNISTSVIPDYNDGCKVLVASSGFVPASSFHVSNYLNNFEIYSLLDPHIGKTTWLDEIGDATLCHMPMELTEHAREGTRRKMLDFCTARQMWSLKDGCFVHSSTSVEVKLKWQNGYIRSHVIAAGFVVRPLHTGESPPDVKNGQYISANTIATNTASSPQTQAWCHVTCVYNLRFPSKLSDWVSQAVIKKPAMYIKGIQEKFALVPNTNHRNGKR